MSAAPKVFISYSHDSEAHKARVLALADRLRYKGGVEATSTDTSSRFRQKAGHSGVNGRSSRQTGLVDLATLARPARL